MAPDIIQIVPEQLLATRWGAENLVEFLLVLPEIWKDQTEPFYNLRKSSKPPILIKSIKVVKPTTVKSPLAPGHSLNMLLSFVMS